MLERQPKRAPIGFAWCGLALPLLLLTHCGNAGDGGSLPGAGASGSSGANAQGAAAGELAGAHSVSGAGGASASASGAGGSAQNGLGGASVAGKPGTDAGAGAGAGGQPAAGTGGQPAAGTAGQPTGAAGGGPCGVELTSFTSPSAAHVAVCSPISYPMNPPVYGDHYPVWAAYKSYSFAVPLGFLVHNLEHGAVVMLYNCPAGCSDEVAAAQAFIDALPADPRCADDVKHQIVMTPDPSLPKRWGAVAWGHSLTTDCFAPEAFRAFYDANVGHGSEDICGNGADLAADACAIGE